MEAHRCRARTPTGRGGLPAIHWEIEESLDIEWAHVMAPMANIILFEASDASNRLYTAVQTAANTSGVVAVSMSWGGGEFSGETAYDSHILSRPQGTLAAPRRSAAPACQAVSLSWPLPAIAGRTTRRNTSTITPQYPACSPNVVAVGGTTPDGQCRQHLRERDVLGKRHQQRDVGRRRRRHQRL